VLALVLSSTAFAGVGAMATAGPAVAAAPIHGIDVSNWQGSVDWGAVRRSGRLFGFAKATEGSTFVDGTFAANRQAMAQAGLALRGFYHFARPDRNGAAVEADSFLRTVGSLAQGEVAVLDLEVAPSPTVGDWAAEWMARVQQATGRRPILYSYQSYLYSIPTARLTPYPLWVAAWGRNDGSVPATPPKSDRWSGWTWWQYTSNASVPGVRGHTDESLFAGSADELASYGRPPAPAAPAPAPDPLATLLHTLVPGLAPLPPPPPLPDPVAGLHPILDPVAGQLKPK
jgi:lysozyme